MHASNATFFYLKSYVTYLQAKTNQEKDLNKHPTENLSA